MQAEQQTVVIHPEEPGEVTYTSRPFLHLLVCVEGGTGFGVYARIRKTLTVAVLI